MFTYRMVSTLVVTGLLAAGVVMGEEAVAPKKVKKAKEEPGKRLMAQYDVDKNGTLSLAEFVAMHQDRQAKRKAKMGDKWDEAKAAKMPKPEVIFAKKDVDKDGQLTLAELKKDGGGKKKAAGDKKEGKGKKKGKGEAVEQAPAEMEE